MGKNMKPPKLTPAERVISRLIKAWESGLNSEEFFHQVELLVKQSKKVLKGHKK